MDGNRPKYDAFISYRHSEPDKFVAVTLHKKLESFKLPKKYIGKTGRSKIERVFRDQDELPLSSNLSDSIDEALHNTDFLIVICSPRLPQSQWCLQEIETFISLYGRERILAVLCEGEPRESFPDALVKEEVTVTDEDGTVRTETHFVEPLAADVRGKNKAQMKKALDDAVLRIAAPMFGLDYDDLKQRHRERRMRQIITFVSIVSAVLLIFSLVSLSMALQIKSQSDMISLQNTEISNRNEEIEARNKEIEEQYIQSLKNNAVATARNAEELISYGRGKDAIYALLQVMPENEQDTSYPYTPETQKALLDALELYTSDGKYTMQHVYNVEEGIDHLGMTVDGKYSLIIDNGSNMFVYDNTTGDVLSETRISSSGLAKDRVFFAGNDDIVYMNDKNEVYRYTPSTGQYKCVGKDAEAVYENGFSQSYAVKNNDGVSFYDEKDDSFIVKLSNYSDSLFKSDYDRCAIAPDRNIAFLETNSYEERELRVYDTSNGKLIGSEKIGRADVSAYAMTEKYTFVTCREANSAADIIYSGAVYAFDNATGRRLWKTTLDEYLDAATVTMGDTPYLVVKSFDVMFALDIETGEVLYSAKTDEGMLTLNPLTDASYAIAYSQRGTAYFFPVNEGACSSSNFFNTSMVDNADMLAPSQNGILLTYFHSDYAVFYTMSQNNWKALSSSNYSLYDVTKSGELYITLDDTGEEKKYVIKNFDSEDALFSYERSLNETSFVGDGSKYVALLDGGEITVYDYTGEEPEKVITPDGMMIFNGNISPDKKYIAAKTIGGGNELEICSLLDQNDRTSFTVSNPYNPDDVIVPLSKDSFAIKRINDGKLEMYRDGEDMPVATRKMSWGFVSSTFVSDDGKYLGISYSDGSVDFLSIADNLQSAGKVYGAFTNISDMRYDAESKSYFLTGGILKILQVTEDLEPVLVINSANTYLPSKKGFIGTNHYKWTIMDCYSYDELIEIAKQKLNGYVPTEKTKQIFNMQ